MASKATKQIARKPPILIGNCLLVTPLSGITQQLELVDGF